MNAKNSPTPNTTTKKYGGLLALVASFLALILVLAVVTYFATQRFEQVANTQKVVLEQSVITQELTKNLLNINLYGNAQLNTLPAPAPAAPSAPATAAPTPPVPAIPAAPAAPAANANTATAVAVAEDPNQIPLEKLPQAALYRIADIEKETVAFDSILKGLKQGGEVTLLDGTKVTLPATTDPEILSYLNNIEQIWVPYQGLLTSFSNNITQGTLDKNISNYLVEYTRLYNDPLQAQLNDINNKLNANTTQNANILRMVQMAGIIASILIFALIVLVVLRRLVRTDNQLAFARRQTDDIMNTVNEGLFLIDKDLVIGDQYSGRLEEILNQKNIAGRTLYELLEGMIKQKDLDTTKLFIEQLYNSWVVEELIQDLNPLKQVLISYVDKYGASATKFVEFNFLRVMDASNEKVESVFVSVIDVTKEVRLQAQMQKDKEQHDNQIEMISYLLNVDNRQIIRFITETKARLERMNSILKSSQSESLRLKAEQLYRETHSLKGDASALNLGALVSLAEKQEDKLKQLMGYMSLKGDDFLPFTVGLDEMVDMVAFIEDLISRLHLREIGEGGQGVAQLPISNAAPQANVGGYWKNYFEHYAKDIAERQGKRAVVQVIGFDELSLDDAKMTAYKDIVTQLLKNAIVHGIESPNERLAAGKPQTGVVVLSLEEHHNGYQLQVKDDGRGIDWEQIRQKAVDAGVYSQEDADALQLKELVRLMFKTGLSTAETQDEDAGRGVGMDIVKQLAQQLGGKIGVQSHANQSTQININFPKA